MQFRYTEDERELLGFARQSFRGILPLSRFRGDSLAVDAWVALGKDGWLHASVDDGDDQLPLATLAGLAREAGAAAAGEEFVQNAWLIPRLCALISDDAESQQWLAAHLERPGFVWPVPMALPGTRPTSVALGAHPGFDRYQVAADGTARLLRTRGLTSLGYIADLSLSASRVEKDDGEEVAAHVNLSQEALAGLAAGLEVLRCAGLIGAADELMDQTVTYLKRRHQFGQPIGRFQAVKHMCADVHSEIEVSWLGVLYAALRWRDDPTALPSTRAQTSSAALAAARAAAQLHGGMGFTWESDLHWLLKSVLDGQLGGHDAGSAAREIGEILVESA